MDFRATRRDWGGVQDALDIFSIVNPLCCSPTVGTYRFAVVLTRAFGAMSRLGRSFERFECGKVDKSAVYTCGAERRDYHLIAKHYS